MEQTALHNYKTTDSMIAFRTCFSSMSYNGYKLDILKSGIQKYLRRREFDKMIWCVAEIYLFQVLQKTEQDKKATKGIITNLINRLIVMMDEELLFNECYKYLIIRKYMEMFEKGDRSDFSLLYKICYLLCNNSKLLRRNSDIRAYFNRAMMDENSGIQPPVSLVEPSIFNEDERDKFYFENFKAYFKLADKNKAVNCYYWMFKILMGNRNGNVKRFRRRENIYMIWEFLFSRKKIFTNPILKKCLEYRLQEFYNKGRNERFIFLTASIDIALFCDDKADFDMNLKQVLNEKIAALDTEHLWDSKTIIDSAYKDRCYMQIDDYVIDMHCSMGRKMGKGKSDFKSEGSLVVNQDTEFYVEEWREVYNAEKMKPEQKKSKKSKKSKKTTTTTNETTNETKPEEKTAREIERAAKYKMIKKMRGKPKFDDLERELEFISSSNIDIGKIKLCTETTCGNKVMCFEYNGKIWKEGRKSMNYNRDYGVLDACKEVFGLEKIGMKRVLSNFRIEKIDKSKKSWADNWHKVAINDEDEKVVYCVMDKVTPGIGFGKKKQELLANRKMLKEFAKIGVFRGIFRVSDFNGRNVLIKEDDKLVSIDEGDIGKRLDIIGGREKWLIDELNRDKSIINEILHELLNEQDKDLKKEIIIKKMIEYKFNDELCQEVLNNWNNLYNDLKNEGIEF